MIGPSPTPPHRATLDAGIVGGLLDLVLLSGRAGELGVVGLDVLGGRAPGFGKSLGLLLQGQVGVLARLALVLGEAEERGQGALGGVGVLERRQALAAGISEGLAARVLGVVLGGGQLLETVAGLLLEDGVVGLVLVLVDLTNPSNINNR